MAFVMTAALVDTDQTNVGFNTESRKKVIADLVKSGELEQGSEVALFLDPDGPYGRETITVVAGSGHKQIGNLPRDKARIYIEHSNNDEVLNTTVSNISHSFMSGYSIDLRIEQDTEWTAMGGQEIVYQHYGERDWEYSDEPDGTIRIEKYTGSSAFIITVPESIHGKKVTCFGLKKGSDEGEDDGVFSNNTMGISYIYLPDSIHTIGEFAFDSCRFVGVFLPRNLKTISAWAFAECNGIEEFTIPSSVTSLGDCAFFDCFDLKTVIIDAKIDSLPNDVFRQCRNLDSVVFHTGIKKIGARAFLQTGLTSMIIPRTVESIGFAAFASNEKLTSVTIPDSVREISDRVFEGSNNVVISVKSGSYAEKWAQENGVVHDVFSNDGTKKRGEAKNIPGMLTPTGPRWNGIYRGQIDLRTFICLRFWGSSECRAFIGDILNDYQVDELEQLELTPPMYSDRFEVVGDNIMIELDGQDGTIRLNGKIGYGANTLTLRLQGSYDDPISLSFQKIDLKYGKERGFYWPEAEL